MTAVFAFVTAFINGFFSGGTPHSTCIRGEKKLRNNMAEDQVDSMIDDSFPASDPPSTY